MGCLDLDKCGNWLWLEKDKTDKISWFRYYEYTDPETVQMIYENSFLLNMENIGDGPAKLIAKLETVIF